MVKKATIISFVLILVFLCSLPVLVFFINDREANSVKQKIIDYGLPPKTQMCDSVSAAGKLNGNGNGMQFFGAILIKSELSFDAISAHYNAFTVERQIGPRIRVIETEKIVFNSLREHEDAESYYIVYDFDTKNNIFSVLDIRGH